MKEDVHVEGTWGSSSWLVLVSSPITSTYATMPWARCNCLEGIVGFQSLIYGLLWPWASLPMMYAKSELMD